MTRPEAISAAESLGLISPRIMPHKAKDGKVSWNLFHGTLGEPRKVIVVPANVSAAAFKKAVESGQAG
jgi:hypothetical protein